ncbi:hypothetical protein GCM10029992_30380 [Glycomyces albus]
MRHPRTAVALAAAAVMALAACTDDGGGGEDPENLSIDQFPRDETLYTTGAAWGPPADWNPVSGGEVTGLRGLGYEPCTCSTRTRRRWSPGSPSPANGPVT